MPRTYKTKPIPGAGAQKPDGARGLLGVSASATGGQWVSGVPGGDLLESRQGPIRIRPFEDPLAVFTAGGKATLSELMCLGDRRPSELEEVHDEPV
jgi:hypothetical protein